MKLSILIPTLPQRKKMFNILYKNLLQQIESCGKQNDVEILFDRSKKFLKGGLSVGTKRDSLKNKASGKYLAFVDDDDFIAPNYVSTILEMTETNPDIITFRSLYRSVNFWNIVDMNLKHSENEQMNDTDNVKRQPFHVCAILTSIAQRHSFPDINNGEDWAWMQKVLTECNSQEHTNKILHQYNEFQIISAVNEIERSK